jgi:uncharacterized membrane protein YhhN
MVDNFRDLNRYTAISISFIYLLTSLYIWLEKKNTYSRFVSIAMVFCFIGDMLLSRFIPGGTIVGMGTFAIAHVLFIIGYINTIHENNAKVISGPFCIATIAYYLYFFVLWNKFLRNTSNGKLFSFASLTYGLLICTMASVAVSLYKNGKEYFKTAIGAFIFLLSDSLIAVTETTTVPHSGVIIWITYAFALYGVIYSNNSHI